MIDGRMDGIMLKGFGHKIGIEPLPDDTTESDVLRSLAHSGSMGRFKSQEQRPKISIPRLPTKIDRENIVSNPYFSEGP